MTVRRTWLALGAAAVLALGASQAGVVAHATDPEATLSADVGIKIIGGKVTTEQWPYTAYLGGCGGTLVAPRWVVTAAHCVDMGMSRVRLDSNNRSEGGEVINVKRGINHPKWGSPDEGMDIGVLELERPAQTTPVPIAARASVGMQTKILGWGATTPDGWNYSQMLKELDTSILAPSACTGVAGPFNNAYELCTDNAGGGGACVGDSGGPQLAKVNGRWELVGETSRGEKRCANRPSIYTNVPAHIGWLREVSGNEIPLPAGEPEPSPTASPAPTPTATPKPTASPTPKPTTAPGDGEFFNGTEYEISDFSTIRSDVNSTFAGAKRVDVSVRLTHQCAENLELALITPQGRRQIFKQATYTRKCTVWSGDQTQSFEVTTPSTGRWILQVSDRYLGNSGRLTGWGLKFS